MTSESSQECPYCWGRQDFKNLVSTDAALEIIDQVKDVGAQRIFFTGGEPLKRADIGMLIQHAKGVGLEITLSVTGDGLTAEFLGEFAAFIDLISLPLDVSCEEVNARTKKEGHYGTIINALEWLRAYPQIDVKLCTPVTRHNLTDVPNIVHLIEDYACPTKARVFYNIFQAFPRSMVPRQ